MDQVVPELASEAITRFFVRRAGKVERAGAGT